MRLVAFRKRLIDFKYNEELLQILIGFVESSIEYDMRGAVLGNMSVQSSDGTFAMTVSKWNNGRHCGRFYTS